MTAIYKILSINFGAIMFYLMCFILPTKLHAQLKNISTETYYISDNNDSTDTDGGHLETGSTTYRIYVQMEPGSKLKQLLGLKGFPMVIKSTANFFNNADRGQTFGFNINERDLKSGTAALDSWLTIGQVAKNTKLRVTDYGIPKADDQNGSLIGGSNNDGGSASIAGGLLINNNALAGLPLTTADGMDTLKGIQSNFNSYGFEDDTTVFGTKAGSEFYSEQAFISHGGMTGVNKEKNQVLIAQITTKGNLSYELNIEVALPSSANVIVKGKSVSTIIYTARSVSRDSLITNTDGSYTLIKKSPLLSYPMDCGCLDTQYKEYDPENFACNDVSKCKTLIVTGCMDPTACNYNPNANYNMLCCYPGSCDGRDIENVCPNLGEVAQPTVAIYPNPVNNQMVVEMQNFNSEKAIISVYDIYGKKIFARNVNTNNSEVIDASELSKGMYIMHVQEINGTVISKNIIKN